MKKLIMQNLCFEVTARQTSEAVVTTANSSLTTQLLEREEILRAYLVLMERKA